MAHQALGLERARARPGLFSTARAPVREGTCSKSLPSQSLGIVSGKGGVGKSTLALNLALGVAERGAKALLVDGDAGLANLDLLMGIAPRYDLSDWRAGRIDLEHTLCTGPLGLELLVVGAAGTCAEPLARALAGEGDSSLEALFARPALTVFDLGAGIGAGVLDIAERCRRIWLVATPEPTSLADAYATAKQLWGRMPGLEIELIVNRAEDREVARRTHQALDRLTSRFLERRMPLRGVLPEDPAMRGAVARQQPVLLSSPEARVANRIRALSESLLEELGEERVST